MDFALTPHQRQMQASIHGVLERTCPLESVRAFAEGREAAEVGAWRALVDLGVPGLLVDEEFGGSGLTLLDAALVCELLGAHVAPTRFLGSAVLAPLAIDGAGSAAQKAHWLPRLAAGDIAAGAAIGEGIAGARDGAGIAAKDGRLTGKALFAIDVSNAAVIIAADRAGGLHLVEASASGVETAALTTVDRTRDLREVRFDNAPAEPLISGDSAATLGRLRDAAWVMLAADMLGASQTMLDKAVAYTAERRQFGRTIGSFQAVKHLCAEMAAEIEPCRALVWYAAYAYDAVPAEASLTAAHAKAHLSEVSRFVARTATEVHGGVGFTDLLGLHYWFKRVGVDRQLLGGPDRVREHAARLQGMAA